jgi:hypothetical protein
MTRNRTVAVPMPECYRLIASAPDYLLARNWPKPETVHRLSANIENQYESQRCLLRLPAPRSRPGNGGGDGDAAAGGRPARTRRRQSATGRPVIFSKSSV